MQARLEQVDEITVVHLSGRIDYESADRFKESCLNVLADKKLIFNLEKLSFVGSSGITPFLETMTVLTEKNKDLLKFCSVGSEFQKIFESGVLKEVEILEDVASARIAFSRPIQTFEECPAAVLASGYMANDVDIEE